MQTLPVRPGDGQVRGINSFFLQSIKMTDIENQLLSARRDLASRRIR